MLKNILKEKESCYATDKVDECNATCKFYWTCKANKKRLKEDTTKSREDILNNKYHR